MYLARRREWPWLNLVSLALTECSPDGRIVAQTVFDAGTLGWPAAVNPFGQPDRRIERVTVNILAQIASAL